MIDMTPLDVRNKRGDFRRMMRGYDPQEVDIFLELVAERLEALIRQNMALQERSQSLQEQVSSQSEREQAVQEALVTAQELRADIRDQSQREADHILREAETEGRRLVAEAEAEARTKLRSSERRMEQLVDGIQEVERRRTRFLKEFRQLLERELDVVEVEEGRVPLEERPIDLELGSRRGEEVAQDTGPEERGAVEARETDESTVELLAVAPAVAEGPTDEVEPPAAPTFEPLTAASATAAEAISAVTPEPEASAESVDGSAQIVPPPDAAIDELAAAYRQAAEHDPPTVADEQAAPPAPAEPNLLLYLDPGDEEAGTG